MGIYVNPGNDRFQSVLRSKIYVDKTGLIEYTNAVLDTENRYICVSRPRRFGKSITADMLAAYYGKGCDSSEIFEKLDIAQKPDFIKYLNQYNVIQIDINNFRYRREAVTGERVSAQRAIELFHLEIIRELREIFVDSIGENESDLPDVLAKIHEATGETFIIIIDEWDSMFREDKVDEVAQKEYIELLRGLFKNANSKKFLKLAYITGILPIKKYGTQSALNNFDEFTMTNPLELSEYVGFTEEEVCELCQEYQMNFEEARLWYDGYAFRRISHIYNPNSVVKAMLHGEYENYWTRTETYESLKKYISMNYDGLKDAIVRMISGSYEKVNSRTFQNDMTTFSNKDDVLTLLIHLGYLAYDFEKKAVYIPNEEVREEFRNAIEGAGWEAVIKAISESEELLQATWN